MKKGNPIALLPILVFLVLYLGFGIIFEYVLKIPMGFYNIPIVVVFLVALLVACIQNPRLNINEKIALMGKGVGDPNIMTMILIFMMAGIFVGVVGRSSANSVAYFILSIIPPQYAAAVLFVISCLVSIAMGTSVGTITLITPIGVAVAQASGFGVPICIGSVMGGAMFGDNLSFISDTTIAACQGQGCEMKDKFRENFKIALPAAIVTLVLTLVLSLHSYQGGAVIEEYDLIQIIPYILVLLGGIIGINVFVVLLIGIVSGAVIMLATEADKVAYVPEALYHYVKLNMNAFSNTFSQRHLDDIRYNAGRTLACLQEKGIPEQDIALFKLNIKLPFLLSGDKGQYKLWKEWYPEADRYAMSNPNLPFRTRLIQWLAGKHQFWAVGLYGWLVNKVYYGIIYRQ